MDGWTKFFVCVGVSVVVYAWCQIIFWIDDPRNHHKRKLTKSPILFKMFYKKENNYENLF